jgi:hypothetical protein
MSVDILTFYRFLQISKEANVKLFREMFSEEIERLPEKVMSSRALIKYFDLDNVYKRNLFNAVFMMYFKEKLIGK